MLQGMGKGSWAAPASWLGSSHVQAPDNPRQTLAQIAIPSGFSPTPLPSAWALLLLKMRWDPAGPASSFLCVTQGWRSGHPPQEGGDGSLSQLACRPSLAQGHGHVLAWGWQPSSNLESPALHRGVLGAPSPAPPMFHKMAEEPLQHGSRVA